MKIEEFTKRKTVCENASLKTHLRKYIGKFDLK